MLREQPTADHDLAEVAEAPAPACAQDNESDGAQPRSKLARRLSSRLHIGNDATRRDTAKGDKKAAKKSRRSHVLKRHTDYVQCLAALDGDRLASGSDDRSIIVWNLTDGTQITKLEGHTDKVRCLAALDGNRLASGSKDEYVIIWNLADGEPLVRLKGHTGYVYCLAALDGERLASGGGDASIIIWNLADGTQLVKLEGHTDDVRCLAALDGNRLASGGGNPSSSDSDNSVIIWSLAAGSFSATTFFSLAGAAGGLGGGSFFAKSSSSSSSSDAAGGADGTQLAKLEGHTHMVTSLAALDGGRLASCSWDKSIIIWNLADGSQLAKLEGHTGEVSCLIALDGDRLASCAWDSSILVWNLADGEQLFKLEGHTWPVSSLAALAGDRLASGSSDFTIRVRPLDKLADLAACSSAFEFEELARSCRDKKCLGDLFDAAVVQFDEKMVESSSAIVRQAYLFDAIAKVITADDDNEALVEGLLDLVRDDDLLPDIRRRGVSDTAIEKLASTAIFRSVVNAKLAAGVWFVLYYELFFFVVLGLCFLRIAAFEVLGVSKWFAAEKTLEIVVGFVILAYFSAREIYQMWSTRAIELTRPENPLFEYSYGIGITYKVHGLAKYALLIPRMLVGLVVCLPLLPVFLPVLLVIIGLRRAGKEYEWMESFRFNTAIWEEDSWFGAPARILHDPLTFLGLSRAWRRDHWNWTDFAMLGCCWAAFVRAAMPGTRMSTNLAVATSMLLWIKVLAFLKNTTMDLATFVAVMIDRIAQDLSTFLIFFLVIILMFASAFYLYLGPRTRSDFGFHDDGEPTEYTTFPKTMLSLYLLGFVGEFDWKTFDTGSLRALICLFIFIVVIVLLNVLIAIVGESYRNARQDNTRIGIYYRLKIELIAEMEPVAWRLLPSRLREIEDEASIKKRLEYALKQHNADPVAAVQADTRRAIAPLQDKIEKLEADLAEVLKLLRARPT